MLTYIKNSILNILNNFNIGIIRYTSLKQLRKQAESIRDVCFILELTKADSPQLSENFILSKSQIRQDLFVLHTLGYKKNGFFVEFGAANGIDLSNTYLLEKNFGWSGILAEPAKCFTESLFKNRSCIIDTDCVWRETGVALEFNEVSFGELSTINEFTLSDGHDRNSGKKYQVNTISLMDLLSKHNAPYQIDYLSIDTEGSEYEILSNFEFSKYQIKVITVEHNYGENRNKIFHLLTDKGYQRVYESVSLFDDWYVLIS